MQSSEAHDGHAAAGIFEEAMPGNSKQSTLDMLFSALDSDSDGTLSVNELQVYMDKCAKCQASLSAFADAVEAHMSAEQSSLIIQAIDDAAASAQQQQPSGN